MSVVHKLAGLTTGTSKTKTENRIVETGLKEFEEVLAGYTLLAGGLVKYFAELTLKDTVSVLYFLFSLS